MIEGGDYNAYIPEFAPVGYTGSGDRELGPLPLDFLAVVFAGKINYPRPRVPRKIYC